MQALVREIPLGLSYEFRSELIGEKLGVMVPTANEKKGATILISTEVYSCLLDSTFNWFFQKSSKGQLDESLTKSDDELSDAKDYGNYRGRLVNFILQPCCVYLSS
jgi:hypothetical protein